MLFQKLRRKKDGNFHGKNTCGFYCSLKIKNKISEDRINPKNYDTCIIHDVTYNGKNLEAEITEYSKDTLLKSIKDGSELPERIKRTISLEH